MALMSSPYFALLRKADMKEYMKAKDGEAKTEAIQDEKLKEYVKLYRKTMSSPLAMGKSLQSRFDALYDQYSQERSEKDIARVKDRVEKIEDSFRLQEKAEQAPMLVPELEEPLYADQEEKTEETNNVIKVFRCRKFEEKNALPENDLDFMRDNQVMTGGIKVADLDEEEIVGMEKSILEIMTKKTFNGVELDEEVLKDLEEPLKNYIAYRREVHATQAAYIDAYDISCGLSTDIGNEVFQKTEIGRKINSYISEEGQNACSNYFKALVSTFSLKLIELMTVLKNHNITIFEKEEARLADEAKREETINSVLKKKSERSKTKTYEFPKITINGEDIVLYSSNNHDYCEELRGKKLDVAGEEGEELLQMMKEYAGLKKDHTIVEEMYGNDEGRKGFTANVYKASMEPRIEALEKKLQGLIP